MSRKTIKISFLIDHVNNFNATSADIYKDEREAKNSFLEMILIEAGNYNGFEYLTEDQLSESAMSVGMRHSVDGAKYIFDDTDHTRVWYFQK